MAKVIIEFEDVKPTKAGGFLKLNMKCDPPIDKKLHCTDGKVDPDKCTIAQILANEIGLFIQDRITHRTVK